MSKFKVGDRVILTESSCGIDPGARGTVTRIDSTDNRCSQTVRWDGETGDLWCLNYKLESDGQCTSAPVTKDQRAIAKAEADLAALKERAALKAQQAAERKAKAERVKLLKGLTPTGRRVVELLLANRDAFGCQRENVIALAAAITGDVTDRIRKALA